MRSKYIVRLDDACPTMCARSWDAIETTLDLHGIRPVVGVIPDNRDPALQCGVADSDFWGRVRRWRDKGWTVALHGLHHTYHAIPSGHRSLVSLNQKSEFVGLNLSTQRSIIRRSWRTFIDNGVQPTVFMAPSHTFDLTTLDALRSETVIRVITDGYALYPYKALDFIWVPQQLWHFRKMPFGLWTVCFHPNAMTMHDSDAFSRSISEFSNRVVDFNEALTRNIPSHSWLDKSFACAVTGALSIKRFRSS